MSAGLPHLLLRGEDAVAALGPAWEGLANRNPQATVFQTSAWYRAWIEAVSAHEGATPVVLLVGPPDAPRAALALQISESAGARTVRPLSWPWADYHDAVGSPFDRPALASLARALSELAQAERCSLVLDDVVAGGLVGGIAEHLSMARSPSSITERIDLTDSDHLARVLDRKEHRVKERRLGRRGDLTCVHHISYSDIASRLPLFIEMHREQWRDREDAVAPFDGGVVDAAFRAFARHLAPRGHLLLTELNLAGHPIAMYFGFLYAGRYGAYRTTYDGALRRLSPGHAMLREMIVDFRAAGVQHLDLMRGDYPYKRFYSNRVVQNCRFELTAWRVP